MKRLKCTPSARVSVFGGPSTTAGTATFATVKRTRAAARRPDEAARASVVVPRTGTTAWTTTSTGLPMPLDRRDRRSAA